MKEFILVTLRTVGLVTDLFKDNIGDYATLVLTYIKSVSAIMSYLRKEDTEQFNELKENGFGVSLTGNVFSTIHGDLVTELFNRETKVTFDCIRCCFSTNINSVNT